MNPPRVVIDTNVFVSAALKPQSIQSTLIKLVSAGHLSLYSSAQILAEYEDVLRRKRLQLDRDRINQLLRLVHDAAVVIVTSSFHLSISPDEPDNRFLECAEAADADYLVTGNKKHFPSRWKRTKVVSARELLDALGLASAL